MTETDTKTQDIMELVRLSALHPDQLDLMLTQSIQMAASLAKSDIDLEKIIVETKEKLFSDAFLKKVAQPFDKIFTHDEIKLLLNYYKSDAVKKLYKTATETYSPIHVALQEIIADTVKPYSATDKVTSLTQQNYQKELKDFKGNAVLDIYSVFCAPCQSMAPIFSKASNELGENVKFLKLDMSKEPDIAKDFEIHSVPTLLFIKEGKIVDRHIGLIDKSGLTSKIKEHLP